MFQIKVLIINLKHDIFVRFQKQINFKRSSAVKLPEKPNLKFLWSEMPWSYTQHLSMYTKGLYCCGISVLFLEPLRLWKIIVCSSKLSKFFLKVSVEDGYPVSIKQYPVRINSEREETVLETGATFSKLRYFKYTKIVTKIIIIIISLEKKLQLYRDRLSYIHTTFL